MAATRLYDWDESEFAVNVPEVTDAAPATAAPDDLVLTVVKGGVVSIADTSYSLDQLVRFLSDARNRYINQGVIIRGDAGLAYQDLADVLFRLRRSRDPQRSAAGAHARAQVERTVSVPGAHQWIALPATARCSSVPAAIAG